VVLKVERPKKHGGYGFSIEDCVNAVLNKLELGYEVPEENRSWY
jgi:hypothetical protein